MTVMLAGPEDLVRAVKDAGVRDARVLGAIGEVPRAEFVPPDVAERAYRDEPLPIGHGQVTTQPSLVARMLEALDLADDDVALEVGTGYGWQTALLARLAAHEWSVERWPDLARIAAENLRRVGVEHAHVVAGDGSGGLPEHAPFDAIVVSAAFPTVPPPLAVQLHEGGRLVQPLGRGGDERVVLFQRQGGVLVRRAVITGAHFVRLYGRHGFRD
jgi:protein-L-isoaspartate(D-aspartate) O-methyltransferase